MHSVPHDDLDGAIIDRGVTPIPWKQFRDELLGLYQEPMVARATGRKMASVLRELEALGGLETTADLGVTLVTRLIAARPKEQSLYTLHSILAVVRCICTYAETAGYLRVSPFRLRKLNKWVRLPKLEDKRFCSREEIRRILDLMAKHVEERTGWAQWRSRRLQAVTAIIAYCGLRRNECLQLHVDDVDLVNRVIWIRAHGKRLKTVAAEAPIPVPAALVPLLTTWMAHRMDSPFGFPIPDECIYLIPTLSRKAPWISGAPGTKALNRLQAVAKLAGVENVTFQALRRAWATHAEFHGLGEGMIQRVLRHTNSSTSKKFYRKADLVNMVQATENFSF